MSKRIHTIEIEGYGSVQIRSLTKRQMKRCRELSGGDEELQIAHIIRRGMVDPQCTDELLAEIDPDHLAAIAAEIINRSWPNEGGSS